jgi:hypothetical protein
MSMAMIGGCAVDGPQADVGETTQAAGATYECLDLCPPPGHGLPPVCHHICVLNRDEPGIGGDGQQSVCSQIHQLKCGDGCCDSQEAARFENGRYIRSSCPSDCVRDKIQGAVLEDGRLHVHDGSRSLATFIDEFFVPDTSCR